MLAVDTPQNLNQRLRQTSQVYLEVIGPADQVVGTAARRARRAERGARRRPADGVVALTVATQKDRDLRAELAGMRCRRASVGSVELRPVALSLEAIFLSLVSAPEPSHPPADHEVPRRLSA